VISPCPRLAILALMMLLPASSTMTLISCLHSHPVYVCIRFASTNVDAPNQKNT
jgi:hypothetical protein